MAAPEFENFVRMTKTQFENLIILIGPKILKQDTRMRRAIIVEERLLLTLRYLATGEDFLSFNM